MPYSTPPDVRLIIDTTLTDTQITSIIQMSDTQIDTRIGPQTTPDELIKKLSTLHTAHTRASIYICEKCNGHIFRWLLLPL